MEFIGAVGRVCASVVYNNHEFFWNVAGCTALLSTPLDKVYRAFPMEAKYTTGIIGSFPPVEPLREAMMDYGGLTVNKIYTCFTFLLSRGFRFSHILHEFA